jgi:intracellular sulfur oxidation DsrE/DsrF family protein
MTNNFFRLPVLISALALGLFVTSMNSSLAIDDKEALTGIKEGKIAFDIKEGEAKMLLNKLVVIDETRQSLIQQGVTPHFVLAFRGPSSKLIQTDLEKIKPADRELAAKIAAKVEEMIHAPGVEGFEQCSLAARQQETKTDLVLPDIKVVGNGFISLMAYQAKGYAYIAP